MQSQSIFFEFPAYFFIISSTIYFNWKITKKTRLHANFRGNITTLSMAIVYLSMLRCVTLTTNTWGKRTNTNLVFCFEQFGFCTYRSAFFTFVLERFVSVLKNKEYEKWNSIRFQIGFTTITFLMSSSAYALLLSQGDNFRVMLVVWIFTVQGLTIPLTLYLIWRIKADWSKRHIGASLSQRFQLSESRSSAHFFVPLVINNFFCVILVLIALGLMANASLNAMIEPLVQSALDWVDFYQRVFFCFCLIWMEKDFIYRVFSRIRNRFTRRIFDEKRAKIDLHHAEMIETESDAYFRTLKEMWA